MQESIFTKIIKGDIPANKIYEDDHTLAFLDIHPLREGHTLVVPKTQVDQFDDLPDDAYTALFSTVKKVASHLKQATGKQRAVVFVMGFDVPHAHVHIVPADNSQEIYDAFAELPAIAQEEPDFAALAAMRDKLTMMEEV